VPLVSDSSANATQHSVAGMPVAAPVLLADLRPMLSIGMHGMLTEQGMQVVNASTEPDLREAVQRLRPSAVVLDLDGPTPHDLTAIVRAAWPEAKVVLLSRQEDVMEVLDPGVDAPRYVLGSIPAELCAELVINQP
jgi:DNA-binding NarL/FixJ family response regulator